MGQFNDFLLQRAIRTNPAFAKNYYMQQNQQADQQRLMGLLGSAGTPEQKYATEGPTEGPMMPGQERQAMPFNQVTQEAVQGTGLLGGQTSPQELGLRMMAGSLPNTRATGSNLLMQAMQPQKQGDFSFQQYQSMGPEERKTYDRYKGRGFTQPQAQPSSVKEWQYFNQLSPPEQQQYMQMKRQTQYLNTGSAFVNPPVMGTSQPSIPIKPKVTETPEYIANKEITTAKAKAKGEALATADKDITSAEGVVKLIDEAIKHKGREFATGATSIIPAIPGTAAYDYKTRLNQLKGGAFLEAYAGLKGGGSITEPEGKKAEQAQARLDEAQTEESHVQALKEMQKLTNQRIEKIKALKGGNTQPKATIKWSDL